MRVGIGYDSHAYMEGDHIMIGGVKIPFEYGVKAHSDGDVLLHALCDALLGAANLGDIGKHFPDNDPKYKGIDSKILLASVIKLVRERGYELGNIDSTICLQQPKIGSYISKMQEVLASCMGVDKELISIKATTTEKLSFVGREEGVSAYATVLIIKS